MKFRASFVAVAGALALAACSTAEAPESVVPDDTGAAAPVASVEERVVVQAFKTPN